MLNLYERVVVKRNIPEANLKAGDVAWLIDYVRHPEGGEDGYVLEIYNEQGEAIAVVSVPVSAIEPMEVNQQSRTRSTYLMNTKTTTTNEKRGGFVPSLAKPGQVTNRAGQYEERGPRGGKLPNPRQVTIEPGDKPLPPTSKPGNTWTQVTPSQSENKPGERKKDQNPPRG